MSSGSFAGYLAGLDEAALRELLTCRPDVRIPPAPRGFAELAQRLCAQESLVEAIHTLDRDCLLVGQALAVLGERATGPTAARLLDAPEQRVAECVLQLSALGLLWADGDTLRLPDLLADHWADEIGGGRPVSRLVGAARVDDLRTTTAAWASVDGLTKPQLATVLTAALTDVAAVTAAIGTLPPQARRRLEDLRFGYTDYYGTYGGGYGRGGADDLLIRAGLVIAPDRRPELPREVAVAMWRGGSVGLTGPPLIAPAGVDPATLGSAATAAAVDAVRVVTVLLDEAGATSIATLKKGGVGTRERSRLAARLSIPPDELALWIDLAFTAGLLGRDVAGFAPTDAYGEWRSADPGRRWATLAYAWFGFEHAPTYRGTDADGKELPPPYAESSTAGLIRRSLVAVARGGGSVRGAGAGIAWFCPLHGCDDEELAAVVGAALREGERLGVVAVDAVSELGEHLMAVAEELPPDPVAALATRCEALLPEPPCRVILQSDLTAVVSGQPSVAAARLLAAAAVAEARGTAAVWRFTPVSVRESFDGGWDAQRLRDELAALSEGPLPPSLDRLIQDVERRHGQVRIRSARSCIVADPATAAEILHTRALAKLGLHQLAPTVLACPGEPAAVLTALRAAGFSPMAEDVEGTVIVESRGEHRAEGPRRIGRAARPPVPAAQLAAALRADPTGDLGGDRTDTFRRLAGLGGRLDDAALELLADAVDNGTDVVIRYRDKNGTVTYRAIQPREVYGRWLDSWCHLRNAQRDFAVENIESVSPAR